MRRLGIAVGAQGAGQLAQRRLGERQDVGQAGDFEITGLVVGRGRRDPALRQAFQGFAGDFGGIAACIGHDDIQWGELHCGCTRQPFVHTKFIRSPRAGGRHSPFTADADNTGRAAC
ncbi:hypothetical protein SDC9_185478 [bioreactor metagenome]|uniref:Uncharacterized protein n=1 Tax=bioreactor metagenome TaxID=1076179 RepID=A0A645HFZ6_9ZZZZ